VGLGGTGTAPYPRDEPGVATRLVGHVASLIGTCPPRGLTSHAGCSMRTVNAP
jgi:hypothetical protein